MEISKVPNQVWVDLILGKMDYPLQALPLKILLSRLRTSVKFQPGDAIIQQSVEELKNLFVKCQNLTSIQNDFITISVGGPSK